MEDACRRHASAAIELGERLGMGAMCLRGRHALGLLALGAGRAAEAARHLDVVAVATRAGATAQPAALWWQADHVEALVRCERADDAAEAVARLRHELRGAPSVWGRGALHRAEALVGPADIVDDRLSTAIECFDELGAPFEVARTLLVRGEARLESGRAAEGRGDLAAARRQFDGLRARPWSERATLALGCSAPTRTGLMTRLSAAELRVAMAISNGDSNRQAAQRLCVSVKTVDYHLQNMYRKLGVHNRTHLARLVSTDHDGQGRGTSTRCDENREFA
jgi:DNA-binding CsgD family transcriptional regulator